MSDDLRAAMEREAKERFLTVDYKDRFIEGAEWIAAWVIQEQRHQARRSSRKGESFRAEVLRGVADSLEGALKP